MSVVVSNELTVSAYKQSLKINQNYFERFLNQGHVSNSTALVNIIAHCSALCNSDNSTDHIQFKLEAAILSFKQYVFRLVAASLFTIFISTCSMSNFKLNVSKNKIKIKKYLSTQSQLNDQSKIDLIRFLIEQLQLLHVPKQARRYSTATITTAFLWQLTSCSLYKSLQEMFFCLLFPD